MCLETNWTKPKTARKDRVVYKIVWYRPKNKKYKIISMFRRFKYQLDKLYQTTIIKEEDYWGECEYRIYEGFHAYRTFGRVKSEKCSNETIVECTIPKGSEYYRSTNRTGEIVSNQIIINRVIE